MAGAILIGEKSGVSMSGIEFDHVIEAIRPHLIGKKASIVGEVYDAHDEGGMDFISLKALGIDDFNLFCDAAFSAFDSEIRRDQDTVFRNIWKEVLSKLDSDPRRRPS